LLRRRDATTFIDVGAFVGWLSVYAYGILRKRKGTIIIAVEPDPKNYVALLENTKLCQFVKTMNVAIYTRDNEEVEFHLGRKDSAGLSQSGSIYPTYHDEEGLLSGESIFVKTIRLDTLIRRSGLDKVDLVKMDIEGAEYPVLTDPTLDLSKVENIIVEVHYRYGSRESWEIMQALARHGLKIVPLYPEPNSNKFHLLACKGEVRGKDSLVLYNNSDTLRQSSYTKVPPATRRAGETGHRADRLEGYEMEKRLKDKEHGGSGCSR
jgi:FkbM family methyltransferase